MKSIYKYAQRDITKQDIISIKNLISANADKSRCYISRELCRLWNWRQKNGFLKEIACRTLLKNLEQQGLIVQPPKKCYPNNPFVNRQAPPIIPVDQRPINCSLKSIQPIALMSVRKTKYEKLYNSLIQQYHYLKYCYPVGEKFKYIAFSDNRPIACICWISAAWHIGTRDKFIGWNVATRTNNLHYIAYNTRLLILPWIDVRNLASYLLSENAKVISDDWLNFYKHPIYFLETFVDTSKFKGTCYKAANWIYIGKTTGRGKLEQTNTVNRSLKDIYVYPLKKNFRELLCQ
jgi:hypothetical protein